MQSVIKSEDLSPDFTFDPLVTGPVHSCAISTPLREYSPAAISAHLTYQVGSTHFHLSQAKHLRVKCFA